MHAIITVKLQQTIQALQDVLGDSINASILRKVALRSSLIVFDERHQTLFRAGDKPKGFYFILKGKAELLAGDGFSYKLSKGSLVGIQNYLKKEEHHFDFKTISSKLTSLFIDDNGYKLLENVESFQILMRSNILDEFFAIQKVIGHHKI